jgi:hypothetical protein
MLHLERKKINVGKSGTSGKKKVKQVKKLEADIWKLESGMHERTWHSVHVT